MTRVRPIALVDTNVWLDNYLDKRPHCAESRAFISEARRRGVDLTYPVHCLSDFFYLVQGHLKHAAREHGAVSEEEALAIRETAWACVEHLRLLATAIGADESDAWRACKYRALTNDLEDNLVLSAAERVPVDFLVTNDSRLLRKATVKAYTPADAVLMLQVTRL